MRGRKVGLGCLVVFLLLAAGLGGGAYSFTRPDERFVHAASIEHDATYQDAALLERAWALPAAALYRAHFDSQENGSFCGPTSVVNVVRSTGGDADQAHVLDGTDITTVFGILPGGITIEAVRAIRGAEASAAPFTIAGAPELPPESLLEVSLADGAAIDGLEIDFSTHVPERYGPFGVTEQGLVSVGGWHPYLVARDASGVWQPTWSPEPASFTADQLVDSEVGIEDQPG